MKKLQLSAAVILLLGLTACGGEKRSDYWNSYNAASPAQQQGEVPESDEFGACAASDLVNFSCD